MGCLYGYVIYILVLLWSVVFIEEYITWFKVMPICKSAFFICINWKVMSRGCSYCPAVAVDGCSRLLEDFLASYFCEGIKSIAFFRLDERCMEIFIFVLGINIISQEAMIKEQKGCFIFALLLNELNKLLSLVLCSGKPEMQE